MNFIKVLLIVVALGVPSLAFAAAKSDLPSFRSEQLAQQHCPGDTVVWVNISSGIYHMPGTRFYGRTKNGAFVCQKEADQKGFRIARNGQ